nr:Disease resistance RPP13-like protein 4 [Cajanus cajan]
MKHLEVLQLGRWLQDSASHYNEVMSEKFLKQLKGQKYLRYISFRGISGISKLPPSIFQLESLETLDLKACHNLETLPNDISSLRNLKHLDLFECPLLERMSKGIEKLTNLKVLKGFVKGSSSMSPYKISDLANLKKLVRLSIYIKRGAVIYDGEFESLEELLELKHLKISWSVFDVRYSVPYISFLPKIEKLHLEGFPGENISDFLRTVVSHYLKSSNPTKVLKITGGKLKSLNRVYIKEYPEVNILILKYLKHLKVDLISLHLMFPSLRYLEIKQISNYAYFEWSKDEDR